ncbi:hypothetical protein OQA88_5065 [Cercophora sp. LCS_1]
MHILRATYYIVALIAGMSFAGVTPSYNVDPKSPSNCNMWYDNEGEYPCFAIPFLADITHGQYISWNPSINRDTCEPFEQNQSYCVGVCTNNCAATTSSFSSTTIMASNMTSTTGTPTKTASSSVVTPSPTQSGIVGACLRFTLITKGSTCEDIARQYGIDVKSLVEWNPTFNDDCSNLKVGYYCCVGV